MRKKTFVHPLELWRNFICGNETGNPGRAVSLHLACSGSQSEHRIHRMLPAHRTCHIIILDFHLTSRRPFFCPQQKTSSPWGIDHFTVLCLVAWPLNESEAGVELFRQKPPAFPVNDVVLMLIGKNLHKKSSEVSIKGQLQHQFRLKARQLSQQL